MSSYRNNPLILIEIEISTIEKPRKFMMTSLHENSINHSVSTRSLIISLASAFLLNLIPLTGWLQTLRPDFLLLVILFWGINAPQKVNFLVIFLLGVFSDVSNGSVIGQTSLLYVLMIFIAISAHRRVRLFKPFGQMLHVFPALLLVKIGIYGILLLAGNQLSGVSYFYPIILTVLFWPAVNIVINLFTSSFGRA